MKPTPPSGSMRSAVQQTRPWWRARPSRIVLFSGRHSSGLLSPKHSWFLACMDPPHPTTIAPHGNLLGLQWRNGTDEKATRTLGASKVQTACLRCEESQFLRLKFNANRITKLQSEQFCRSTVPCSGSTHADGNLKKPHRIENRHRLTWGAFQIGN